MPIVYWMAGLRGTFSAFIQHLLVVYLVTLVASSLGLFIGCVSPNPKQAQTIASVPLFAVMRTGGFYFDKTPACLATGGHVFPNPGLPVLPVVHPS